MTAVALVLAGGSGERARLGRNKALAELDGTTLLRRSVAAVAPHVDRIVVVVRAEDRSDAVAGVGHDVDDVVVGGATRHGSEAAGLAAPAAAGADVVAVHDAARPLVPGEVVAAALAACRDAQGAVPALPRAVPLARPAADGTAVLVARDDLVGVQTPQAVRAEVLRRAFAAAAGLDPATLRDTVEPVLRTDPSARVVTVPGSPINLKVTWPDDLARAAALAAGDATAAPGLVVADASDPGLPGRVHVEGVVAVSDALRRVDGPRVVAAVDRAGLVDLVGEVRAGPGVLDPHEPDPGRAVERAVTAGAILTVRAAGSSDR